MAIEKKLKKSGVVKISCKENLFSHIEGIEKGLKERGCKIKYEEMKGNSYFIHFSYNKNA